MGASNKKTTEIAEVDKMKELHWNYMEFMLVDEIRKKLPYERSLYDEAKEDLTDLSGFMSAVYNFSYSSKHILDKTVKKRSLFVKFMKGDENFRKSVRAYTQFENEIFSYNSIIPYYEKVIKDSPNCKIDVNKWVPIVYCAQFGTIEGVNEMPSDSSIQDLYVESMRRKRACVQTPATPAPLDNYFSKDPRESVLALENLAPHGFRGGPRLHLDRDHLKLMAKLIGEYHSLTYALRIRGDQKLENLIGGVIPLPFTTDEGINVYQAIYTPGFTRFFRYLDDLGYPNTVSDYDPVFIESLKKFRDEYGERPLDLLERFREVDEVFSVILHGDYNRNNVLFHYNRPDGFEKPDDIRMIDFQEMRYGSPAIDLAFFMYMNMDPALRETDFWMELLKYYHSTVINSVCDILGFKYPEKHESLKKYSFENFYEHFSKFAFYGALVCIHFIPWMICSEEECAHVSHHFEKDMFSEEFKEAIYSIGGEKANRVMLGIVHHAWRQGYLNKIFD